MRLKNDKDLTRGEKTKLIGARCDVKQFNSVKQKALLYCDGNVSEWVLYAALNYIPKKKEIIK